MAEHTLKVLLKHALKKENEWKSQNPVIANGVLAFSSDKNYMYKIGNGTSTWSQLKYAKANLEKTDISSALGFMPVKISYGSSLPSTGAEGELFLLI